MRRFIEQELQAWRSRPDRKPLVLRGARQVGKTHVVREFARRHFRRLVEVNFELEPDAAAVFASPQPASIVSQLELRLDIAIRPGETLLFLDEIQAAPDALPALRYFYEEMPELHVIAAGSLLEFVLHEHHFSMPVGRIEYLHLGPMQFEEFLLALDRDRLQAMLADFAVGTEVPPAIHQQLMQLVGVFLAIGGMPEAVSRYVTTGSHRECERVKHSLLATFRDDFAKYRGRTDDALLRKLLERIPQLIGQKFKYVNVDREVRSRDLARALGILTFARVCHRVRHSTSDGIPLGAQASDRHFKMLFLDVGLLSAACGLTLLDFERADDVMLVNAGGVCEQFVGQHLLHRAPPYVEPQLHYWMRERRNSSAEVDYVIQVGTEIIPLEVKAGRTGTLKSMHLFLREKQRSLGVRLCSGPPSLMQVETSLPDGRNIPFRLLSLPLYLAGQISRLCRDLQGS